jgi:hypothetical protein
MVFVNDDVESNGDTVALYISAVDRAGGCLEQNQSYARLDTRLSAVGRFCVVLYWQAFKCRRQSPEFCRQ